MHKLLASAGVVIITLIPAMSFAATLGSLNIDDTAFADDIATATGKLRTYDSTIGGTDGFDIQSPSEAGSGSNVSTGIWCTADCSFDVFFSDNILLNGAGNDLAIFEGGANESLSVSANGTTIFLDIALAVLEAGFVDAEGFQVGYWLLDLTDFGVAPEGSLSEFRVDLLFDESRGGDFASADFVAAGGLNLVVVPLPATLPLFLGGFGFAAFVGSRRKIAIQLLT